MEPSSTEPDATIESCAVCGFVWDAVTAGDIGPRAVAAAAAAATALRQHAGVAAIRPAAEQWSMLEYGGHMRDVLLNLRDRIVLGLAEENPTPKPMYGDLRIDSGLYAADTPTVVADELQMAAALFARTFAALTAEQLHRPIFYGWPRAATRNLLWVAAQAVHEAEHHATDVEAVRRSTTS